MFFSLDIVTDKSHPLHFIWLLSCYMDDSKDRKKLVPDTKIRRADLVMISKELMKMFRVEGRRTNFALDLNTDMLNAVFYSLEFKACDLFSKSQKLLISIRRPPKSKQLEDVSEALINLDKDFRRAAAKKLVKQQFPNDQVEARFDKHTMYEPESSDTIFERQVIAEAENDFGIPPTFDFLNSSQELVSLENRAQAQLEEDGLESLLARHEAGQDDGFAAPDFPELPEHRGEGERATPPRIQIERPSDENNAGVLTPPPVDQTIVPAEGERSADSLNVIEQLPPPAVDDDFSAAVPMDEDVPPAMATEQRGEPEKHPQINVIPETQESGELPAFLDDVQPMEVGEHERPEEAQEVDSPRRPAARPGPSRPHEDSQESIEESENNDMPPPRSAKKLKKPKNKKRKLLIDAETLISREELRDMLKQPVVGVETPKEKPGPDTKPRNATQLFQSPMNHQLLTGELAEFFDTRLRIVSTQKRNLPEDDSSSSSSEEEEEGQEGRGEGNLGVPEQGINDGEISSLRDTVFGAGNLPADLSRASGLHNLDDVDLPGFMEDNNQDQELDRRSELRNATEDIVGQEGVNGSPLGRKRGISDLEVTDAGARDVSDIFAVQPPSPLGRGDLSPGAAAAPPQPEDVHQHTAMEEDLQEVGAPLPPPVQDLSSDDVLPPPQEQVLSPHQQDEPVEDNLLMLHISTPETSAGELLDKIMAVQSRPALFTQVCDPATTDQMFGSVTFFNLLKLQRASYVECDQRNLMDPIHISLCNKNDGTYQSSSEDCGGQTTASDSNSPRSSDSY
eukprot:TRINITY_DN6483_c0_g1_i6.p1 TRINITY_DN6483_c0_g1~~TRINITY_DN6483_c0_g1_i6.p1  ORF type:complete len:793 (-),score=228.98 TRINITY_DN6483_c0_g1_i6:342-2720(-)